MSPRLGNFSRNNSGSPPSNSLASIPFLTIRRASGGTERSCRTVCAVKPLTAITDMHCLTSLPSKAVRVEAFSIWATFCKGLDSWLSMDRASARCR